MKGEIILNIILKTGALFAFLLIAFSIAYYFVYFLPQKEKSGLEQQNEKYEACLQKCDAKYPTKLNMEGLGGEDYRTLYETCNFECREKYAKPLPSLPKLPEINLPE